MKNWQFITIIILIIACTIIVIASKKDTVTTCEINNDLWSSPQKELNDKLDYIISNIDYIEIELNNIKKEL